MSAEIEYNLTPEQWEALRALRAPSPKGRIANRYVVENLVKLQLVEMIGDNPVITPKGRSVLLRGSPQLWDLAA
jgi:ribosomal protein S19E (S16A)